MNIFYQQIYERLYSLKYLSFTLIFLTIFTFFISSCITLGQNFSDSNVKAIRIGKTTKKDIRKLFGSPWLSGINDGELAWTYGNYDYALFGERKAKDLVIQFDDKGVVTTFTFSTTEHNE